MLHKTQLRAFGLEQRKSLSEPQRQVFSQAIMASLFEHLSVRPDQAGRVEAVLIYRSMASEVSTDAMLKVSGFRLFSPVTQADGNLLWLEVEAGTDWNKGVFDVLEPADGELWQPQHPAYGVSVVVCPLTAFDRLGNRLGMGKGCFDRWLSRYHQHVEQVIGLAFSCQEVTQVPVESHDMVMDYVITEKEVIACMSH